MEEGMAWLIPDAIYSSGFNVTEIVSGHARGADTLGEKYAYEEGILCTTFPADWEKYGKAAGPIRNKQMADYADAAIVFIWDGSRGSKNMIETMKKLNKPVYVVENGKIENS